MKALLPSSNVSLIITACILLQACAIQPKPPIKTAAPVSIEEQKAAQQQAIQSSTIKKLTLKRKVALGRITNETMHGKSMLRDSHNDPLGKQVSDMLSQRLIESGQFLIIERPDISRLKSESELSGSELNIVGVDSLIMGSLTEFGRTTTGSTGFWSKSKKQTATAKVAMRLVDTSNGLAYFSATGAGEASTESGESAFSGSTASYDGALNDKAISNAISDVVDDIIRNLNNRPWSTYILSNNNGNIYISGGELQGIKKDMIFDLVTKGKKIKSPQTGFFITLPGEKIAKIRVLSSFGDSESSQGSITKIVSGSIGNKNINDLKVMESINND
ncbi:CsgG/HfaB family protein [Dasania marina]|uniref:CsgG/HfaB family protein n=1 Tax=Dasania marina TaxID=471499 RepID=UPI0003775570|nr:CsgG/HfaB family protein [Dasania marina]